MRTLIAYVLALVAIGVGVWFGFFSGAQQEDDGSQARRDRLVPVIVAPVVEAPFAESLPALGTARANESVELTANRTEHVAAIHFEDGQQVEAGQLLVELDATEEQAMLAEASALLVERRTAHKRAKELNEKGISPESDVQTAFAQMQAAQARVDTLKAAVDEHQVRAPFAGVLGLRRISVGALLQTSTVITTLDDLSVVKVDFTVPEKWLSAVQIGQTVAARSDAFPKVAFTGRVAAIDTRLDERTRAAMVRARIDNPELRLRPGMLIKVDVERGEQPTLQLPEEAVVQKGDVHFVFVIGDDEVARQTNVTVGRRRVGYLEILDGVTAGQRVVVEGLVRVRNGSKVDVVDVRDGGS